MSDTKTSGLSALAATPATGDLFMVVDVSDTTMAATGTNKYLAASYVVSLDRAETLTNKTLTTPVIGDFTNAGHSHTNSAGGGQLDHGTALTGLGDDDHPQYELESNNTGAAILAKLLPVDGAGSGLDADLLDGNSSAAFLLATGATTGATSSAQAFTNGITTSAAVGILNTSPGTTGSLNVSQENGKFTAIFGSDISATTMTNNTRKAARLGFPHITNAEEPVTFCFLNSDTGVNDIYLGGATGVGNAVTGIYFFTAANATTLTGSERMRIISSGYVGIGVTSPTALLHVAASTTARASVCKPHGSAPTSPVNGDEWTTTAGSFVQINGTTKTHVLVSSPATYTPSNVTTDRTYDADATTLDEVADVLGTLIADLKLTGIIL